MQKLNIELAEEHNNLGIKFHNLGKLEEAEASYRKALELNPDFAEAHYNLGQTYLKSNQVILAAQSFSKAIKADPKFNPAHIAICESLYLIRFNKVYTVKCKYKVLTDCGFEPRISRTFHRRVNHCATGIREISMKKY